MITPLYITQRKSTPTKNYIKESIRITHAHTVYTLGVSCGTSSLCERRAGLPPHIHTQQPHSYIHTYIHTYATGSTALQVKIANSTTLTWQVQYTFL